MKESNSQGATLQVEATAIAPPTKQKKRTELLSPSELASLRALPFLTTEQVSQLYGIPEATLKYWRKQTKVKEVLHGPPCYTPTAGMVVYDREEVEKWFRESNRLGKLYPQRNPRKNKAAQTAVGA